MIESICNHPAGRFTRCRDCGTEPRHVRAAGRSTNEPVTFAPVGIRHKLECRDCGARTGLHATLTAAEAQWGTDYAQLALPLRVSRRRRAA